MIACFTLGWMLLGGACTVAGFLIVMFGSRR